MTYLMPQSGGSNCHKGDGGFVSQLSIAAVQVAPMANYNIGEVHLGKLLPVDALLFTNSLLREKPV